MTPRIIRTTLLAFASAVAISSCDIDRQQEMVGTLERDRITLTLETSEPIVGIHVSDGQQVTAGTLLLEQDPERLRLNLSGLEAERDVRAARLAELERGPREESIREARANLESAEAETVNARDDLTRVRGVFERGLSTEATLDNARTRYATAQAQERARREALDALLNGTTVEELQQAAAALQAAEAAVEEARLTLQRASLSAPVDAQVDKVLARLGERPIPGQAVAVLLDTSRAYARVYVPEPLKGEIVPGRTLQVAVDGRSAVLDGTVRWVSSEASFTPYFALTEHDRSRLSYVAEIDLDDAADLPTGLPLVAIPPAGAPAGD